MPRTRSQTSFNIKIVVSNKLNGPVHACGICSLSFKSKKGLKEHSRSHPEVRPNGCKKCGKRFKTEKHLELHLRAVHGPKVFVCEQGCGQSFARQSDLESHSIVHVTDKPLRCKICRKRFKTEHYYKNHYRVHATDATFVPASEVITNPRRRNHRKESTSDSDSSEEHGTVEKKIRVFTCDICNKHFRRNFNLKRHRASHLKKKNFPCKECDPEVPFSSVASREEHYATFHCGKPFKCLICHRLFKSKSNKDIHVLTHLSSLNIKVEEE